MERPASCVGVRARLLPFSPGSAPDRLDGSNLTMHSSLFLQMRWCCDTQYVLMTTRAAYYALLVPLMAPSPKARKGRHGAPAALPCRAPLAALALAAGPGQY